MSTDGDWTAEEIYEMYRRADMERVRLRAELAKAYAAISRVRELCADADRADYFGVTTFDIRGALGAGAE